MNEIEVTHRFPGLKFLVGLAALMVVVAGLREAGSFMIPILFSVFLAILGTPATRYLRSKGVPKVLTVLLVAILLISALSAIGYLFYTSLTELKTAFPKYQERLDLLLKQVELIFNKYGIEYSVSSIVEQIGAGTFFGVLGSTFKSVVGAVSVSLVVLIIMTFMLLESADFRDKIALAMGEAFQEERFAGVAIDVQRYVGIKTFTSFITGVLVGILTYALNVDFWLLWGLVAFVLNYVPIVGSIIASIPAIVLGFIQFGTPTGVILIVFYLAINNGVSNFLEPMLMGPRLGLSPLVVFLSLIVWGWVWGPAGMLLSVPLTMVVKILLEHSEEFRWIAILMANRPRMIPPQG